MNSAGGLLLSILATTSTMLDQYLRRINEGFAIGLTSVLIIVSNKTTYHCSLHGVKAGHVVQVSLRSCSRHKSIFVKIQITVWLPLNFDVHVLIPVIICLCCVGGFNY